jgi:hypothetical protein
LHSSEGNARPLANNHHSPFLRDTAGHLETELSEGSVRDVRKRFGEIVALLGSTGEELFAINERVNSLKRAIGHEHPAANAQRPGWERKDSARKASTS